jgi:type IV pilus assembly protein PilM
VTAVSIASERARPSIVAHATERLPEGAVKPGLAGPNIVNREDVIAALDRVLKQVGRPRRIALVVPDSTAKVSVIKFEKLPERRDDLDQLVRWQVKKSVPFPLEQAQVSWTRGTTEASGATELVVAIARRDVVEEYEGVCQAAGADAGLVDLATFNLINVILASNGDGPTGGQSMVTDIAGGLDWLLVHVAPDSSTMAILRGSDLILFRNRPADGEGSLADLVHQTTMYYEDRLSGQGFAKIFVTPRDLSPRQEEDLDSLWRTLADRAGSRVAEVDVRAAAAFTDRIAAPIELLRALAAPAGAVLRER